MSANKKLPIIAGVILIMLFCICCIVSIGAPGIIFNKANITYNKDHPPKLSDIKTNIILTSFLLCIVFCIGVFAIVQFGTECDVSSGSTSVDINST